MWNDPFSLGVIGILLTLLIGFIIGGVSVMKPEAIIAKCCFSIAAFILIGWIGWAIQAKGGQLSNIKRLLLVFIIFGIVGFLWDASMCWVDYKEKLMLPEQMAGVLIPNNKSTPSNPCENIPSNAVILLLGNSATSTFLFPTTVIKIKDKHLLTINKEQNKLTISAELYSRDGKIVAQI